MTETALSSDPLATIRSRAAEWIVQIEGAGSEQERAAHLEACHAWRGEDARHEQVFQQMQRMWSSVDAPPPRGKKASAVLAIAILTCVTWAWLPTDRWLAEQRTARGEVRRLTLADGSVLTLDSATALDVRIDAHGRVIRLHAGRVLAEVAKDEAGRAFVITGRDGTAHALGTRYIVDQRDADTRVEVLESRVAVASRQRPNQSIVLQAGEGVQYTDRALGPKTSVPTTAALAWTNARLVFNEAPLKQVIAELARYRPGVLTIQGDEKLQSLRFTGVLPLDDTDAALRIVAQNLQLKISKLTPYMVWVEAP
ncbi:iron dicitrate transport regulator FecR [Hylemonella gracilis str. Niagara R]|uniref:Iron dicitrate transport regulator FecR n=1 Tax=Hylemonella gracilis str. Niagara R TaxID=1458275 RepID=A0A016XIE3_9BURK|nr:FecR domain-containing protein [Hylemonella gracilis]EYC51581.1 iron dicitrate transport regulator FecR [Hylemonella gracilis str. Niagara R]